MFRKPVKDILAAMVISCLLSVPASASMIDFDIYRMLDIGMSEGEIIYRAGTPDKEIYFNDPARRSPESIKQYFYIPLPGDQDPQLTLITFKNGIVTSMKRVQVPVRSGASYGGQINTETYIQLRVGMSEGEVLTRAGFPDKETEVGIEKDEDGAFNLIRQLTYIPSSDEQDPHLTVITIKQGRVITIDRTPMIVSPYK
jgi:hypothetical protein